MDRQGKIPEIRIRLAIASDTSSIASVLYEAFAEYESLYTQEAFAATTPTSEQIEGRLGEGPTWIAVEDVSIVGTVGAAPRGQALYVRSMAVLPAARGHRIGELLLDTVEAFASAHGYRRLFLSTTPFLGRAISLYERWGFRRSDEGPHELFGTPLFTMVKVLDRRE
jgi:GNAT superfamily N-acetyltransferase